jgi:peptidoglycan/xylan/chitin deacetylase (PgdA/CDA1 family)
LNRKIQLLCSLFSYVGINALVSLLSGARHRAVVLCYHRVVDENEPYVDITQGFITTAQLEQHVRYLLKRRKPFSLMDLIGRQMFNDPVFCVTFDDGYGDNYRLAFPVLQKLGVTATVFPTTSAVEERKWLWWDRLVMLSELAVGKHVTIPELGIDETVNDRWGFFSRVIGSVKRHPKRDECIDNLASQVGGAEVQPPPELYLNWGQVLELMDGGWDMGGHTVNHPVLTAIPLEQARWEIETCTRIITERIGVAPRVFAYPNGRRGDSNTAVKKLLADNGYIGAFLADEGPIQNEPDNYDLERITPRGDESITILKQRITTLYYRLKG